MALVVRDRVKTTTTTTGTGTLTLGSPALGFQGFSVIGDGNTTYYTITDTITGDWEVGLGTYTSSGTTLARNTVLDSSAGGSLVNFAAGSKDVFVMYPSEKAVYQDAAGDVTVAGNITGQEMTASNGLLVHSATITISHTVPSGYNVISAGPITIADGVTVTITDGTWVIA
jgi:hypothetical protein